MIATGSGQDGECGEADGSTELLAGVHEAGSGPGVGALDATGDRRSQGGIEQTAPDSDEQ